MTISEASRHLGVSRRTVERYRDGYTDARGYHAPKMPADLWIQLPSGRWRIVESAFWAWVNRRSPVQGPAVVASDALARRLRSQGLKVVGPNESLEGRGCHRNDISAKAGGQAASIPGGSTQRGQGQSSPSLGCRALVPSNL